jgi:hypothetical protein
MVKGLDMRIEQGVDNIVSFSGFRKDMKFPAISEIRAYWEALRNGRTVPMRSEVDPRGIERSLEHAFILERIAPQVARFRLAGMHLTDLMGMEVRGMPLTALFAPVARVHVAETVEQVFAGTAVADLALVAETGFGKPPLAARLLLLPLQSDLGDISRALGCLVAEGHIGRTPRRFDIAEATMTAIRGAPATAGPTVRSQPGFAEPQRRYDMPSGSGRSHLRLVRTEP